MSILGRIANNMPYRGQRVLQGKEENSFNHFGNRHNPVNIGGSTDRLASEHSGQWKTGEAGQRMVNPRSWDTENTIMVGATPSESGGYHPTIKEGFNNPSLSQKTTRTSWGARRVASKTMDARNVHNWNNETKNW